ncbi:MAG: rod shape-determining protein MreC [Kiritimatiellia bacterium]
MRRERKVIVCVVCLAIVLVLNLPASCVREIKGETRDSFVPFQNVMWLVIRGGGDFLSSVTNARGELEEKKEMEREIAFLNEKIVSLENAARENEILRDKLGFASRDERSLRLCEVVGRDISGWWQTLTLNAGAHEGVKENMAVITSEGLVGHVKSVSRHTATVLLITDQTSRAACRLSRSGAFGVIRGAGVALSGKHRLEMLYSVRPCVMDYIPSDSDVKPNDQVLTSGLGGVYPSGLLVGYVTAIRPSPSALYQRAEVVPAAELRSLKYVFVVMEEDGEG